MLCAKKRVFLPQNEQKMRLAAELRPNPLREFTAFPKSPSGIKERQGGEEGNGKGGERKKEGRGGEMMNPH